MCVDFLAEKHGFKINKLKFKAVIADTVINSHRCIVMKPQTYMNLSGEAVKAAADFYKIPPEKIIVIFDDISLDVGRLRIRRKGSDGGHNGIKSIISCIGSQNFPRVKIGCGKSLIPITTLPHGFSPSTKRTRHRSLKRHLIMPAVRWSLFWTAKQTKL